MPCSHDVDNALKVCEGRSAPNGCPAPVLQFTLHDDGALGGVECLSPVHLFLFPIHGLTHFYQVPPSWDSDDWREEIDKG